MESWMFWFLGGVLAVGVLMIFLLWMGQRRTEKRLFSLVEQVLYHRQKQKAFTLQMQAYERLVLLLERLHPSELVRREYPGDQEDAHAFYQQLLRTIQAEFMHNVTQQIYVSDRAWEEVLEARDRVLEYLTKALRKAYQSGGKGKNRVTARDFARELVRILDEEGNPVEGALIALRSEMRKFLAPV